MRPSTLSPLRRLGAFIYGPSLLFSLGEGILIPLLPLLAIERGASLSAAGMLTAAVMVGQFLGNIPAGALVARWPEKWAMAFAGTLTVVCGVFIFFATLTWTLAIAAFLVGMCSATYGLARQAFLTLHVPYAFRGRSLALLGGTHRAGMFTGPFATWLVIAVTGDAALAIGLFIACAAATTLFVVIAPEPADHVAPRDSSRRDRPTPSREHGVIATTITHRSVLLRLGLPAAFLAVARSGRQVVLPLWGVMIGLTPDAVLAVVALSGFVDLILFYPGGQLMDRLGRMWGVLPAAIFLSSGLLGLALTAPLSADMTWYIVFAVMLGVGNGLSSGALLTLASDLAPPEHPSPFIGTWRTLTQGGSALSPLLVSVISAAFPLAMACAAISVLGFAGVAGFLRWIPRYLGTRGR